MQSIIRLSLRHPLNGFRRHCFDSRPLQNPAPVFLGAPSQPISSSEQLAEQHAIGTVCDPFESQTPGRIEPAGWGPYFSRAWALHAGASNSQHLTRDGVNCCHHVGQFLISTLFLIIPIWFALFAALAGQPPIKLMMSKISTSSKSFIERHQQRSRANGRKPAATAAGIPTTTKDSKYEPPNFCDTKRPIHLRSENDARTRGRYQERCLCWCHMP